MPAQGPRFEVSSIIQANPDIVWDILTDYRNGHPRILPPEAFSDLRVEAGGRGEGTIITFTFHRPGFSRVMRARVSAPEPGRTLVESQIDGSGVTTFTLTPIEGGRHTEVHIITEFKGYAGVVGALFRLLMTPVGLSARGVYLDELRRLNGLAQQWASARP